MDLAESSADAGRAVTSLVQAPSALARIADALLLMHCWCSSCCWLLLATCWLSHHLQPKSLGGRAEALKRKQHARLLAGRERARARQVVVRHVVVHWVLTR